ncbi:hypothetical protein J6590_041034 [Homalodisca vitripennis]|nr:hypothetical protein J6590_041034 [Homalodisca vitripennis]
MPSIDSECFPAVMLADSILEEVHSTKLLGIHLDRGLTWNDHIDHVGTKLSSVIYVLRSLAKHFPTQNTGSGRLKLGDFKDLMCSLKYWQTAFKNHTKEKTGILKAERLKDALLEVGFQLSTDVLSILVLRYMRKDGTLRFGDFVSAILHLSVAFKSALPELALKEWHQQLSSHLSLVVDSQKDDSQQKKELSKLEELLALLRLEVETVERLSLAHRTFSQNGD